MSSSPPNASNTSVVDFEVSQSLSLLDFRDFDLSAALELFFVEILLLSCLSSKFLSKLLSAYFAGKDWSHESIFLNLPIGAGRATLRVSLRDFCFLTLVSLPGSLIVIK